MRKVVDSPQDLRRGDKIFAKIKGHPYWPAKILSINKASDNIKYHVYFYGTKQVGVVKAENVCSYSDNKMKYGIIKKSKFLVAMGEIENDTSDEDTSLSTNSTEGKLDETHDRFGKRKTKIIKNIELEIVLNRLEKNLVDNVQNRNISSDSNLPESNEDSQKDSASSDGVDCDEVDEIDDSDDCIFAEVGNEKVKIPLNLNQPEFTSEKSKAEWYKYVTVHANSLKNRIEGGEELDPIDEMDGWTMMKEMEHQTNYDLLGQESEICNILLMEGHLLDIDLHLRRSLNTMDPDFDACFLLFDHLINLPIMAIMLKKHPHIVAYIDELRCYVSSIYPELTSDELKQRIDKSEIVRLKSEMAMAKFSEIFHVNRAYFMEKFIREVEKLRIRTCTLSEEEFYFLSEDPE